MKSARPTKGIPKAHQISVAICTNCTAVHIELFDRQDDIFAVAMMDKDAARAFAHDILLACELPRLDS